MRAQFSFRAGSKVACESRTLVVGGGDPSPEIEVDSIALPVNLVYKGVPRRSGGALVLIV